MNKTSDEISIVDNVIKEMNESFKSPFYTNTDVRAACAVGAFVSYAIYLQETKFQTKGQVIPKLTLKLKIVAS